MLQAMIKKGKVLADETPAPLVSPGSVLIQVVASCVSAGTEVSGINASGNSLIKKALQQPEKVAVALKMVRDQGLQYTWDKIQGHLEGGSPTGYSAAGVVLAVAPDIIDLRPGQKVAAAGAGYANHAQFIDVPRNLVCPLPEGLDFIAASTVTLGAIAMQGVRRAKVELGEFIVVVGLGFLGLLTVQMLNASGARVIALDIDSARLELARNLGAELAIDPASSNVHEQVLQFTGGRLADAAIFCAATSHSQALSDAFNLIRRKGRLVMVGVWGNEFKREDVYAKELDFLISCSYGPGRYDPAYEELGRDYPYAYVRWTENRNMQEYLRLLSSGAISLSALPAQNFPIEQVEQAYASLNKPQKPILLTLDYGPPPATGVLPAISKISNPNSKKVSGKICVGLLGAGDYATGMHLPNLKSLDYLFNLKAICSRTGSKAKALVTQFQAAYATTQYQDLLDDPDINLVVICTRHNLHGMQVLQALQAGKHVLTEKPLALSVEEVDAISSFYADNQLNPPMLCVGFNRRFSPYAQAVKQATNGPLMLHYRMNAGFLPSEHWVHGQEGGGRIVGEACHIIDLFRYLTGAAVVGMSVADMYPVAPYSSTDNKIITLEYADGSVGSISYVAIGSSQLPKETLEVHWQSKSLVMDNYRGLTGYGVKLPKLTKAHKGQKELLLSLGQALGSDGTWPISLEEILETSYLAIKAQA